MHRPLGPTHHSLYVWLNSDTVFNHSVIYMPSSSVYHWSCFSIFRSIMLLIHTTKYATLVKDLFCSCFGEVPDYVCEMFIKQLFRRCVLQLFLCIWWNKHATPIKYLFLKISKQVFVILSKHMFHLLQDIRKMFFYISSKLMFSRCFLVQSRCFYTL